MQVQWNTVVIKENKMFKQLLLKIDVIYRKHITYGDAHFKRNIKQKQKPKGTSD